MSLHRGRFVFTSFCVIALLTVLVGTATGCTANEANPAPALTTSASITDSTGTTSTTLPSLLSEWDREIARTAEVQRDLGALLTERGGKKDDPLLGLYYGLQARIHALSARKALAENNMELADTAMLEVYYSMNLGRNVATSDIAQTLARARTIIDAVGAPSEAPERAAKLLEEFIAALAPLLEQTRAALPTTSST